MSRNDDIAYRNAEMHLANEELSARCPAPGVWVVWNGQDTVLPPAVFADKDKALAWIADLFGGRTLTPVANGNAEEFSSGGVTYRLARLPIA